MIMKEKTKWNLEFDNNNNNDDDNNNVNYCFVVNNPKINVLLVILSRIKLIKTVVFDILLTKYFYVKL